VIAEVVRKWANGVAAAGPKFFKIYKGRGLRPELLFALKWCLVTWIISSGVIVWSSGLDSG
jgi:hypothetical protein